MKNSNLLDNTDIARTLPRDLIIRAIESYKYRHFSAENILEALKRKEPTVSRATVFRALKLFSEKGLLRAIDLGKGFQLYELAKGGSHHDHLHCLECGAIIEFHEPAIEKLQEAVCMKHGFKSLQHALRISGICAGCKKKKRS